MALPDHCSSPFHIIRLGAHALDLVASCHQRPVFNYDACVGFLDVQDEAHAMQMAFLMATSATLEGAAKSTGEAARGVCLELANSLLLRHQKAAQALADRQQSLGEPAGRAGDKSHVYMLMMVRHSDQHYEARGIFSLLHHILANIFASFT